MTFHFIRCSLCKEEDVSKQYVSEGPALEHLGEHSKFFLKKHLKYLSIVCRVCGGPLPSNDGAAVSEHFSIFHPVDCFASREDFEDATVNIQDDSAKSRWDSIGDSDSSEPKENENTNDQIETDVNLNESSIEDKKEVKVKTEVIKTKSESVSSESNETFTSETSKEADLGSKLTLKERNVNFNVTFGDLSRMKQKRAGLLY